MDALHQIGAIDKKTMRDFDTACLADLPEMEPEEIRALREREGKARYSMTNRLKPVSH